MEQGNKGEYLTGDAFRVVRQFEATVAAFCGAPYAVATMTGTHAIFLALQLRIMQEYTPHKFITLPARTFISVPLQCMHAGFEVVFADFQWHGSYQFIPLAIFDSALRFRRKMYNGGLECLSFQARKILNIGEGGMILCEDREEYEWLSAAANNGRKEANGYSVQEIEFAGWHCYMTPEKAARGLHLMEYIGDGKPDQIIKYPDLRECKLFQQRAHPLKGIPAV